MNPFALVFLALLGYVGYRAAAKHQAEYGRPPWNVSPVLWGLIVFALGGIVGGILLWAASRADRSGSSAPAAAGGQRTAIQVHGRPAGGRGGPGSVL